MFVITSELLSIRSRGNNGRGVHRLNAFEEVGGIVGFIGHDGAHILYAFDEVFRLGDVVTLTASQTEASKIAQAINSSMNLGTQAPTRTAKTLFPVFFDAPAACWWARTIVLSRKTSSKSASSQSVAKSVCQIPLSAQREKRRKALFQAPNSGGRSRHGAPVRAIQSTASTKSRLSAPVRPRSPALPCSMGSIRSHWSSRSNNLGIPSSSQKTGYNHNSLSVNRAGHQMSTDSRETSDLIANRHSGESRNPEESRHWTPGSALPAVAFAGVTNKPEPPLGRRRSLMQTRHGARSCSCQT